ncbi:MAG: hypothetical protein FWH10_04830 [Oscillospiraceae bacterium]|nr:hypothetical protein [Oscillospiraceae bacterium]
MKAEYTAEDLKGAIKNPFFHKLCKKVEVVVDNKDYAIFEEIANTNGETPESVMKRCLKMAAKELQEHD